MEWFKDKAGKRWHAEVQRPGQPFLVPQLETRSPFGQMHNLDAQQAGGWDHPPTLPPQQQVSAHWAGGDVAMVLQQDMWNGSLSFKQKENDALK